MLGSREFGGCVRHTIVQRTGNTGSVTKSYTKRVEGSLLMANLGAPLFDIDTGAIGRLTVHKPNVGAVVDVQRQIGGQPFSPGPIVEAIIQATATRADGERLTAEDVRRLDDGERQRFAELYLEHNPHLLEPDMLPFGSPAEDLPGGAGDDGPEARLARGWVQAHRWMGESARRFSEKVRALNASSGVAGSLLQSLKDNQARSDNLGVLLNELGGIERQRRGIPQKVRASLAEPKPPSSLGSLDLANITAPPNPAHEANERLAALERRFDEIRPAMLDAVAMIKSLNDAAAGMVLNFAEASTKTDKFSRRSMRVAVAAAVIAMLGVVVPIIYDLYKSGAQDAGSRQTIERIVGAIADVRGGQADAFDRLTATIEAGAARDTESREALRVALERLSERLKAIEAASTTAEPPAQQREGEGAGHRPDKVPKGE